MQKSIYRVYLDRWAGNNALYSIYYYIRSIGLNGSNMVDHL